MVTRKIVDAVCQMLHGLFKSADHEDAANLGLALGTLYRLQRCHEHAKRIFQDCLKIAPLAGVGPKYSLQAGLGLAIAYSRLEEKEAALAQYLQCRELLVMSGPRDEIHEGLMLEVTSGLAAELHAAGQRQHAESLANECFEKSRSTKCGAALYNLALIWLGKGQNATAEALAVECLDAQAKAFGQIDAFGAKDFISRTLVEGLWHPDALDAMAIHARALELQGKHDEAVAKFRDLLAFRERFLGPEHCDTCDIKERLSAMVRKTNSAVSVQVNAVTAAVSTSSSHAHCPSYASSTNKSVLGGVGTRTDPRELPNLLQKFYGKFLGLTELRLQRISGLEREGRAQMTRFGMEMFNLQTLNLRFASETSCFTILISLVNLEILLT